MRGWGTLCLAVALVVPGWAQMSDAEADAYLGSFNGLRPPDAKRYLTSPRAWLLDRVRLGSEDEARAAILELVRRGDTEAAPVLAEIARDSDVRPTLPRRIPMATLGSGLTIREPGRIRADLVVALYRFGHASGLSMARADVKSPRAALREAAVWVARQSKDRGLIEGVAGLVRDPHPVVRKSATRTLLSVRDRRAISPLLAEFADGVPLLERNVLVPLAEFRDPRVTPVLEKTLARAREHAVREWAARALGVQGDRGSIPELVSALDDRYPNVRGAAAEALGLIGDPVAKPALKRALSQSSPMARSAFGAEGKSRAAIQAAIDRLGG